MLRHYWDSWFGHVQWLIENNQRRNATACTAENAVMHLAETQQSQCCHAYPQYEQAQRRSHAPGCWLSAMRFANSEVAATGASVAIGHLCVAPAAWPVANVIDGSLRWAFEQEKLNACDIRSCTLLMVFWTGIGLSMLAIWFLAEQLGLAQPGLFCGSV